MKSLRQAQSADLLARAQEGLEPLLSQLIVRCSPRVVFAYLAMQGEVNTRRVIDEFVARGIAVLVPRLLDATRMVAVEFPGWNGLEVGRLGIPTPPSTTASALRADLVLVPGLAFSRDGERLGFGAGYYDRWLAEHRHAVRVGLCYEFQICDRLPVDSHDERVDYLVTERRITACTRAGTDS